MDVGCLRVLFENATRDASLFPPRCCPLGALELDDAAETHLGPALVSRYRQKAVEYRTKDPVYCSNPRCSVFLRGACAAATALPCTECSTVTCGACKRGAHPGETCESSRADEALLELAKAHRWTRCPSCHAVVERTGPDHAPHFRMAVRVEGLEPGYGEGTSKRVAEQAAAGALIAREGIMAAGESAAETT